MQAFNDFLIFGGMAVASFSSGQLLEYFGWAAINEVIFPTIFAGRRHAGVAEPAQARGGDVTTASACSAHSRVRGKVPAFAGTSGEGPVSRVG